MIQDERQLLRQALGLASGAFRSDALRIGLTQGGQMIFPAELRAGPETLDVRWVPVIDSARVIRAGVLVAVAALAAAGSMAWARAFARAARAAAHRG